MRRPEGRRMLRPFPARVRARVEPLDTHPLDLTVDRLNRATIGSDDQLVAPVMQAHLLAASRDEPNAGVGQQTGGIGGADRGRVADEPRPRRQGDGHLVERRQLVRGRWQKLEADRRAVRRADQMQAPAKQPLVVGCAIAARRSPARVATAPRADPTADTRGHAVDDDHVPAREPLPWRGCQNGDPIGKPMQPSVAARAAPRPGQSAELAHHARRPLVTVLEVVRSDHGDGSHVRIRRLRPRVAPMARLLHGVVNYQQRCAHLFGVHTFPLT